MAEFMSLMSVGLPFLHGQRLFEEEFKQSSIHHRREMRLDFEIARRDLASDVKDVALEKLESIMVMDSLMLGCAFGILIEGTPSRTAFPLVIELYGLALGLSFACFFISVWFVMRTQSRMSQFNILEADKRVFICGNRHMTFFSFYACHCKPLQRIAMKCYYAGVGLVFFAAALLFYSRYIFKFRRAEAALLFCGILMSGFFSIGVLNVVVPGEPPMRKGSIRNTRAANLINTTKESMMDDEKHDHVHDDEFNPEYSVSVANLRGARGAPSGQPEV